VHHAFLQIIDVMNLCFIHALLYNMHISKFKAHEDPGHFDDAMIHLMQLSLVIPTVILHFRRFDFHKAV